jgi:uncharacterized protein (TIGR04255 family)
LSYWLLYQFNICIVGTMSEGDIYPNAPVALVALEVRHPSAGPLSMADRKAMKRVLNKRLPILRSGQVTHVEAVSGEAPRATVEQFPKYFSRSNTTAASIRDTSIVLETVRHGGWEDMRSLLADVLTARQQVGDIDGVERIGLRYINEIRVPESDGTDWGQWVDASLLGQAEIGHNLGFEPMQWQGFAVFNRGIQRFLALRHGPQEGYAVEPGGDLKRPTPTPGPYFLLDIDSFWATDGETPEFDIPFLLQTADDIHEPVRSLFESLITDRLRKEVLSLSG